MGRHRSCVCDLTTCSSIETKLVCLSRRKNNNKYVTQHVKLYSEVSEHALQKLAGVRSAGRERSFLRRDMCGDELVIQLVQRRTSGIRERSYTQEKEI